MSKENIKKILREGVEKNALGVEVTRPDQELIVMRGIQVLVSLQRLKNVRVMVKYFQQMKELKHKVITESSSQI